MNLCLSILKDELPFSSKLLREEASPSIVRQAFLRSKEEKLLKGVVYLAEADSLPEKLVYEEGAALICIGTPSVDCRTSGVPLLVIDEDIDLMQLSNELSAVFLKHYELEVRLNRAVQTGKGLQELVDIMTPQFGNELYIVDSNHLILAHSFDELKMFGTMDMELRYERKMMPIEVISFFANNKRWIETKTEREPFIYDEGFFAQRQLCMNIITEVEFSCRITLGETDQPFRSYDAHLIKFFAEFVRIVYEGSMPWRDSGRTNNLRDSLKAMLSGTEIEPWRISHGLQVIGYADDAQFLCLCIKPEYWDYSNNTVSYYCEQLQELFAGMIAFEHQGDIICLVNLNLNGSSQDLFLNSITPFFRDNNFRAGVSESFSDVNSFKDHYRQAEIALSNGMVKSPLKWVHRFYEQAVDFIVSRASKYAGTRTLCAEKILTLFDYDAKNDSSYIETLDCYYSNQLNIVRAAASLNIHRATMVYRLGRIEEIAGIDPKHSENYLFYWLSIRLLQLTRENIS